jgi:hypothetical protein
MKNTIRNSIFIIGFLAILGNVCWGGEYDFRKTKWGMSKSQVLKAEKNKPECDDCVKLPTGKSLLGYPSKVLNKDVLISYFFINNQLTNAQYQLNEEHSNKNDYINDYQNFKEVLLKKYGKPIMDEILWRDDLYKDKPQDWGSAVSIGHLRYLCVWKTPTTRIGLSLSGDNYEVSCAITYTSLKHKPLIDKAREKQEAEDF